MCPFDDQAWFGPVINHQLSQGFDLAPGIISRIESISIQNHDPHVSYTFLGLLWLCRVKAVFKGYHRRWSGGTQDPSVEKCFLWGLFLTVLGIGVSLLANCWADCTLSSEGKKNAKDTIRSGWLGDDSLGCSG